MDGKVKIESVLYIQESMYGEVFERSKCWYNDHLYFFLINCFHLYFTILYQNQCSNKNWKRLISKLQTKSQIHADAQELKTCVAAEFRSYSLILWNGINLMEKNYEWIF